MSLMNVECLSIVLYWYYLFLLKIEADFGTLNCYTMSSGNSLEAVNPPSILASNSCEWLYSMEISMNSDMKKNFEMLALWLHEQKSYQCGKHIALIN